MFTDRVNAVRRLAGDVTAPGTISAVGTITAVGAVTASRAVSAVSTDTGIGTVTAHGAVAGLSRCWRRRGRWLGLDDRAVARLLVVSRIGRLLLGVDRMAANRSRHGRGDTAECALPGVP
jgi:hypothetical protein